MRRFLEDLREVYTLLEEEQRELQRFYDLLKKRDDHNLYAQIVEFAHFVGLELDQETMFALINRLVSLREDAFLQVIAHLDEEEQIIAKERAFLWVSEFYIKRFGNLIEKLEKRELLSPFYRALIKHAHRVGQVFSSWQSSWMAQIIYGTNRELFRIFHGDEEKIFELVQKKRLMSLDEEGNMADRSYSVIEILPDGGFQKIPYALAFKEEVSKASYALEQALEELSSLEDEVFGQKEEWLEYLRAIQAALTEEDVDRVVGKWADVDRCWMRITTPIQLGHPLEYYEDHYTKAVALEWDVRVVNPDYPKDKRSKNMKLMFQKLYEEIGIESESIYEQTLLNLARVQTYVGRPLSFYGSEFNGLFSAQVVPNDERVSKECGKKIFAYPDFILQTQRAKPKMRLYFEIYPKSFADRVYDLLNEKVLWHRIYDITTLGHEYGHILWMDEESEVVMNKSGMFKNIEEFKATTGALVTAFIFQEDFEELFIDHIHRTISLIGWMDIPEVLPYYIEGLLHLCGLFESGVLRFDEKLHIDLEYLEKLREWYMREYRELVKLYLQKRDAKEFLDRFIKKEKNFLPLHLEVKSFVLYYKELYQRIGTEIYQG